MPGHASVRTQPEVKDYEDCMRRMDSVSALSERQGIRCFYPRDPARRPEPAGPGIVGRRPQKMDFRD